MVLVGLTMFLYIREPLGPSCPPAGGKTESTTTSKSRCWAGFGDSQKVRKAKRKPHFLWLWWSVTILEETTLTFHSAFSVVIPKKCDTSNYTFGIGELWICGYPTHPSDCKSATFQDGLETSTMTLLSFQNLWACHKIGKQENPLVPLGTRLVSPRNAEARSSPKTLKLLKMSRSTAAGSQGWRSENPITNNLRHSFAVLDDVRCISPSFAIGWVISTADLWMSVPRHAT